MSEACTTSAGFFCAEECELRGVLDTNVPTTTDLSKADMQKSLIMRQWLELSAPWTLPTDSHWGCFSSPQQEAPIPGHTIASDMQRLWQ